jgi:hypothetical protein
MMGGKEKELAWTAVGGSEEYAKSTVRPGGQHEWVTICSGLAYALHRLGFLCEQHSTSDERDIRTTPLMA